MRASVIVRVGVLALLGLLGSCSAIVSEIAVTCENDCRALNEHQGLGDADCFIYQCRADKNGCEKRARDKDGDGVPDQQTCGDAGVEYDGALDCDDTSDARLPAAREECDGEDDDCDGVIDEGSLDGSFSADPALMLNGWRDVAFSAFDDGLELALQLPGETSGTLQLRNNDEYVAVDAGTNCAADGEPITGCVFKQIAIASSARGMIAAGVNLNGCGSGQVRLGASFDRMNFTWQHTAASTLRFGVDSDFDGGTTPVCSDRPAVRSPSAALLNQARLLQGLLLWRESDPRLDAAVPGPLRGIAFDLVSDQDRLSVTSPNRQHSELVSAAHGLERAALASWPAAGAGGYFIAYDEADSIELAFVPRSQASSALTGRLQRGEPIRAGAPRHIVLALDPEAPEPAPETLGLGIAWHEGNALKFAPITFDPADAVLRAGATVHVADAASLLDGPVLAYQRDGFRADPAMPVGGWYVLWLEQGSGEARVRGARVAQADLAAEETFLVSTAAPAATLFASPGDGPPRFAYVASAEQPELYIGSLGCQQQP